MLNESTGEGGDRSLLITEGIDNLIGHAFVCLGLDGGGAVQERFLYETDYLSFGSELVAFGIVHAGHRLSAQCVDEKLVGMCSVDQPLGKAVHDGSGLEIVFVVGKIF